MSVPQGSVLGPIEFCIFTILLGAILNHYKINYQYMTLRYTVLSQLVPWMKF